MNPCDKGGECDFREEYYGWRCVKCGLFYAFGCAPWDYDSSAYGEYLISEIEEG